MKLIDNAKEVLLKGYVAWLVYIGTAVQIVFEFGLSSQLPGWAIILILVLILLGRTLKQESVSGPAEAPKEFVGENVESSGSGVRGEAI